MRIALLLFLIGAVHGRGGYVGQRPSIAPGQTQYQTSYQQQQQYVDSAPGNQYFRLGPDGSYDFGYDTGSGAYKNEQKTASGQVVGKYGYSGPDGSYTNVQYEGQGGGGGVGADGLYRDNYDGSGSGGGTYQSVQYGHTLPVQPGRSSETAQTTVERRPDGSYSFNVQSSDQSRVESGTPDGQVQGGYSFVGTDGVQRSVSYTAGQQGFQASGAHLPTDSNTLGAGTAYGSGAQRGYSSSSYAGTQRGQGAGQAGYGQSTYGQRSQSTTYKGPAVGVGGGHYQQTSTQYRAPVASQVRGQQGYASTGYAGTAGIANRNYAASSYGSSGTYKGGYSSSYDQQAINGSPKPFSFSYNAGDHGRQESQDASGVVRGSYVVNGADGKQKELSYQADDDGFRIVDEKVIGGGTGSYSAGTGNYAGGTGSYAAGTGYAAGAGRYAGGTGSYAGSTGGYASGAGRYAAGGAGVTSGVYTQTGRTAYGVGGGGAAYASGQKYKPKSIHTAGATAY